LHADPNEVSKGMTVRVLARANNKVNYANGKMSELKFHQSPDGAAVIPLDDGGYVYVSNSEASNGKGGVYGLYFDSDGNVVEYKALLKGTSNNCGCGEYINNSSRYGTSFEQSSITILAFAYHCSIIWIQGQLLGEPS